MIIKITTDNATDISSELLQKYNIGVINLPVILGTVEHLTDITPEKMYAYTAETGSLPKTAAPNIQNFTEFFHEQLKDHDALIHISMSSGISSAYQNAVIAVKNEGLKNVYVVDSHSLSAATALLCIKAHEMLHGGIDINTVINTIEGIRDKLQISFIIDTLDYLFKNGRCSALSAFFASKLSLKPTIIMNGQNDGKMLPGKKYMKRFEKAAIAYAEDILDNNPNPDLDRVFLAYTVGTPQSIVKDVAEKIKKKYNFNEVIITVAGPVITTHCGKGTIGIFYLRK